MTDVLVLHAALPGAGDAGLAATLLAQLPYGRRLELERRDAAVRLASLAGTALVLAGAERLRGRPAGVAQLHFPQDGKPSLADGPWFSVSHSGRRVAVALSERGEVGLDLEDMLPDAGARGPGRGSLERWTATEAALKAVGAGVRAARDLRLSEDRSVATLAAAVIHLRSLALAGNCVASLATLVPVSEVTVVESDIPWPCVTG
jgi:phosphopantetheinyl transferase